MGQGHQYRTIRLATIPWAAGGGTTMKFDKLTAQLGGRVNNLRSITFNVRATPSLSSGSMTAVQLNNLVKTLIINDCIKKRFEGSFPSLRAFEALENGRVRYPEPDAAATGEQVNMQRCFDLALAQFTRPHDFVDSAAIWMDGTIEFGFSSLAEINANLTALNATIEVNAQVFQGDDILLGTQLERKEQTIKRDVAVPKEALYAYVGLAKSKLFDAFTAGDVGRFSFQDESITPDVVDRHVYEDQYHRDMGVAAFSEIHGDPRASTDDNAKVVNGTAIASAPSYLQPAIWCPPGARISKLQYSARPNLTLNNDGTLSDFYAVMSRLIPRTSDDVSKYGAAIQNKLGLKLEGWGQKFVTLKGAEYKGTRAEYMPIKLKRPATVG